MTRWTYGEYLEINFGCGWVTPFDPRTHARKADFASWKQGVIALARVDPARAEAMIRSQPSGYSEPRRYSDIGSLARDCCGLELTKWREGRRQQVRQSAADGRGLA